MKYTAELESFVRTIYAIDGLNLNPDTIEAHAVLSTFVQLIREEASAEYSGDLPVPYSESISNAFNAICERFGLEGE